MSTTLHPSPTSTPGNSPSQFNHLPTSGSFNESERKWIFYVIGGVLIAVLLLVVMQRTRSYPLYVTPGVPTYRVPVYRLNDRNAADGRRVGDPGVLAPEVRFPTQQVVEAPPLPVYASGPGGQVMPYVNGTGRDRVVKEATFVPRNAGRPLIPGVGLAAYEIRFGPADFNASEGLWRRAVNDLVLPASSQTLVVVHIVDPAQAGRQIYGTLILQCAEGEPIEFESAKVVILPE